VLHHPLFRDFGAIFMMDSWSQYYNRPSSLAEQTLYDCLFEWAEMASPPAVLDAFHQLFIEGTACADAEARRALEIIVNEKWIEREFKFILNRSCYILINRWLMQPHWRNYVPELVALLDLSPTTVTRSRTTQRLRELMQRFCGTEQYLALHHLAQVILAEEQEGEVEIPLRKLIHRYPCLYEHTLLTEDSPDELRRRVRSLRGQAQNKFEVELSHYLTYRKLRGTATVLDSGITGSTEGFPQIIKNPTLLSDRQIDEAVELFTGRVDGFNTLRDQAKHFTAYSRDTRSYGAFKEDLYAYLISAVDLKYGQRQFNQGLYRYLQTLLSQNDSQKMSDVLLITTCCKLLNYLVVESPQQPSHFIFNDLTANLGTTRTIGLLLKIVLICRRVKHHLERRFAILFTHYEACVTDSVSWLVEALENLNIALSTNFGSMKLC
jgi:hypothetical protein